MVVDLSELLDLSEEGFAVQTAERMETNRPVTLCLDMTETSRYLHGQGQVIWSDDEGRGGIRFSGLSEGSRQILKEWLFGNLLVACSNHAARSEQLAHRADERPGEPANDSSNAIAAKEANSPLASIEEVRAKVGAMGAGRDTALRLITERALNLTDSSGAALAFLADDKMICRVRVGDPAPPLGATLDTAQGLSGECVRSGRLVSCEDTEKDARVDVEVCRALGIGTLMIAPIVSEFQVVGVLAVFSLHPRSFSKEQTMVLEQLVQMIPKTDSQGARSPDPPGGTSVKAEDPVGAGELASSPHAMPSDSIESSSKPEMGAALAEPKPEVAQQVSQQKSEAALRASSVLTYRTLIGLAIAAVITALGYVVGAGVEHRAKVAASAHLSLVQPVKAAEAAAASQPIAPGSGSTSAASVSPGAADSASASRTPVTIQLAALRVRADAGDADAQWQMGVRYHDGEGVPHDDGQAVGWFLRAADQGNVAAQGALGAYYWRGRGVPADLSKAYFWSAIAMAQGDEMSKSRVEGLSSQMTAAQVAAAREQADAWIRAHLRPKARAN